MIINHPDVVPESPDTIGVDCKTLDKVENLWKVFMRYENQWAQNIRTQIDIQRYNDRTIQQRQPTGTKHPFIDHLHLRHYNVHRTRIKMLHITGHPQESERKFVHTSSGYHVSLCDSKRKKAGIHCGRTTIPPVTVLPRKCYRCPDFSPHLRRFYIENVTGGSASERKVLF